MTATGRRLSPWARLVAVSAAVVAITAIAMVAWWSASREKRVARFDVEGALSGIALDVGDADVDVVGAGPRGRIRVARTEHVAFGRVPAIRRVVDNGVLHIRARCPSGVPSSCSSSYRVAVPDNVPVTVRAAAGDVTFAKFHGSAQIATTSGDISAQEFCGFSLQARTDSGDVDVMTACPLETLALRSRTGDVRAAVPRGRYRVDASSDEGARRVSGVEPVEDSPFTVQVLSSTGDAVVEAVR
jgi:hypothetical protein